MIERNDLVARLLSADPRVIKVIAPAGYGKSTLVAALAKKFSEFSICDCANITGIVDFCKHVIAALAREAPAQAANLAQQELAVGADEDAWQSLAIQAWSAANGRSLFAFENAESIAENDRVCRILSTLLASGSGERCVAVCSRVALPLQLGRGVAPHQVMTLTAADLRLTHVEIREAFARLDVPDQVIARAADSSRGWAVAVFLLARFAREGKLEALLDRLDDVAFADLHDYLTAEVLAGVRGELFEALLACVALPRATAIDVACALGIDDARSHLRELTERLPLVTRSHDDAFEVNPLLAATIVARHAQRCRELARTAADGLMARNAILRAAKVYLALGDRDRAAHAIERAELAHLSTPSIEYADVMAELDEATLAAHPRLWAAAMTWRAGSIEPHERIRQCESIWRSLAAEATPTLRGSVAGAYFGALTNVGRFSDAERLVDEYEQSLQADDESGRSVVTFLRTDLDVKFRGCYTNVDSTAARFFAMLTASDATHALFLSQCVGNACAARGERDVGATVYERAIELAFRAGLTLLEATVLADAIEFDWIAGDDTAFERHVSMFEALMSPAVEMFSKFFVGAARGGAAGARPRYETVERRTFAYLMLSAHATDAAERERCARLALAGADESSQPLLRVLARVTLGEIVASERRKLLKEASDLAAAMESRPLQEAVAAVRAGTGAGGMLQPLLERFRSRAADALTAASLPASSPLSKREREISELVAAGMSNREIAAKLVLSERTVENHISSAFNKLGIGSRAALASYVTREQRTARE